MESLARPFVPLIVGYCFPKGDGLGHLWLLSTMAIAITIRRPIPQPRQTGSPGGFMADEVLRKSTRGRYTSAIRTREKATPKKQRTAHCTTR